LETHLEEISRDIISFLDSHAVREWGIAYNGICLLTWYEGWKSFDSSIERYLLCKSKLNKHTFNSRLRDLLHAIEYNSYGTNYLTEEMCFTYRR
jgi:hypothetical protein